MSQIILGTIQIRRQTADAWTASNRILASGEWGLETDTRKVKIGDGVTPWNSLAYHNAGSTFATLTGDVSDNAALQAALDEKLPVSTRVVYARNSGCALNSNVDTGGGTDDRPALQAILDTAPTVGHLELVLDGVALISSGLVVRSNTTIRCLPGAGVYLANGANSHILMTPVSTGPRYVHKNIAILGGVWNGNEQNQNRFPDTPFAYGAYWNFGFLFTWTEDITLDAVTIRNPRTFATVFANCRRGRIHGHLTWWDDTPVGGGAYPDPDGSHPTHNRDGIHFYGNADDFLIDGFETNGDDDSLAFNTDEGTTVATIAAPGDGAITNVTAENIFLHNVGSGLRFLGGGTEGAYLNNITIRNVRGHIVTAPMFWGGEFSGNGNLQAGRVTIDGWHVTGQNALKLGSPEFPIEFLSLSNVDNASITYANAENWGGVQYAGAPASTYVGFATLSADATSGAGYRMTIRDVTSGLRDWIWQIRPTSVFGGTALGYYLIGQNADDTVATVPFMASPGGHVMLSAGTTGLNGGVSIGHSIEPGAGNLSVLGNIASAGGRITGASPVSFINYTNTGLQGVLQFTENGNGTLDNGAVATLLAVGSTSAATNRRGNLSLLTRSGFDFWVNGGTTLARVMDLFPSGGLSLGSTTDPGAGNLSVAGTITTAGKQVGTAVVQTVTATSGTVTINNGTDVVLLAPTGGALTGTLTLTAPLATNFPASRRIAVIDPQRVVNSTFTVSIARAGTDTINGGTSNVVLLTGPGAGSGTITSDGVSKLSTDQTLRANASNTLTNSASFNNNTASQVVMFSLGNADTAFRFRNSIAGNTPLEVSLSGTNSQVKLGTALTLSEIAEPATPTADTAALYLVDVNGISTLEYKGPDGFKARVLRDNLFIARNESGATIAKGAPVYLSGVFTGGGIVPIVSLARSDALSTMPVIGIAAQSIANNSFGRVMIEGRIDDVDTSAFTVGQRLFVSSTTVGALVNVEPAHPNLDQRVALCIRSHSTSGSILVDVKTMLGDLLGTIENDFRIGNTTSGAKSITFRNSAGTIVLSSTPTGTGTGSTALEGNLTVSGGSLALGTQTTAVTSASDRVTTNGSTFNIFQAGGVQKGYFQAGGDFNLQCRLLFTDATYDIGASATTFRPRHYYGSGDGTFGGNLTVSAGTLTGGASGLSLASGGTNQNITLTPSGTGVSVINRGSYRSSDGTAGATATTGGATFKDGLYVSGSISGGGGSSSPTTTRGDMIRRGASADERLAISPFGAVLGSDGTDPSWDEPQNFTRFFDDFTGASGAYVDTGGWTFTTGGGTFSVLAGETNAPGILVFSTSTSASASPTIHRATNGVLLGGGKLVFRTRIKLPNLSDGTETYLARVGLIRDNTPTNGVYFEYTHSANSGNWQAKTTSSSTTTTVNSSVAPSTTNWQVLQFVVAADGSSVEFFIDGVSIGTSSTNIPLIAGREVGVRAVLFKTLGTTARSLYLDYVLQTQKLTTSR